MQDDHELRWQRSSRCESAGCVEVASAKETVLVRQSDRRDEHLSFSRSSWAVFIAAARAGEFDSGSDGHRGATVPTES